MHKVTMRRVRRGESICITYYECVSVALVRRYGKLTRRIFVICVMSGCTIFFHIFPINGTIFRSKLWNTKYLFGFSLHFLTDTFFIFLILSETFLIFLI